MLDIVITHYKEPWEVCRPLFETLDAQRGVDWDQIRVTVVNDGGIMLPGDKLIGLSYWVQQLDIPHGGIRSHGSCSATVTTASAMCSPWRTS